MAPMPENFTARLFIRYTSGGQEHEAVLRLGTISSEAEAISAYGVFAPLLAALLPTADAVLGARFQATNAVVSFPIAVNPVQGTAPGSFHEGNKPEFISFTGRSQDGRRVRFTVFTPVITPDQTDYRNEVLWAEPAAILAALKDPTNGVTTVSGMTPIWNNYLNIGYNSYYQRKLRRAS